MFNVGSVQGYLKLNTTGWTSSMRTANASINTLARSFAKMGAVAVGSLFLIEREFGKFDKAIRHATSVSETTNKQFERMSEMALDASVRWNKAATKTAQAFYFLGSAGLSVTEQMAAFNDTIMLSRAMGSELSQTVEGTVDVVRAFGLAFSDITTIADQLTKTVISSNQQFRTLSQALSYAASTARLTNNTLAETTAMLGVMANAGIKGCYDDQTEVLTKRGWLPWNAVTMNDAFATTNPHTGFIEYQKPTRLIRYHHKGKMYHVANRGIDLCVTPDHRMWVKKRDHDNYFIMTAKEVDGKNVQYKAGGLHWHGFEPEYIELKGFSQNRGSWVKKVSTMKINAELWVTFLGWYISEGSCDFRKGCYRVRITQNQGAIRDKMREVLSKLPVTVNEDKNGFIINNEQIWRAVEFLGKAPQKHIPLYALDWSPRLLNILLDALMEGDGDCNGCYYTSSKRLADNVSEIALKMGYAATVVIKSKAGEFSNYDKEKRAIVSRHEQLKVSVRKKQLNPSYYPSDYTGVHGDRLDGSKFPNKSEWIDYDGEVFCAEVPNHLLIVRRNGKILVSGNSMAGTVLRRAMTNLMAPTGGMAELIYELGLNIYDTTGRMKPFINIMGQISDKLKGATHEYKNMVFEVLFGRRAIAGQIVLFNYGSEALRKYADEIKNAGGTTERVAGKQMKAFTEQLGQLWREMQRIAIMAGDTLAPAIERLANQVRFNLGAYRDYIKLNSKAVAETLKWTAAIGTLLLVGGPLLLIITSLAAKMVALATVIANPFIILIAALYTLRAVWKQTSDEMTKNIAETILSKGQGLQYKFYKWGAELLPEKQGADFMAQAMARAGWKPGDRKDGLGAEQALTFKEIWDGAITATTKQLKADFGGALDFANVKLGNMDGLVGDLIAGFKEYAKELNNLFGIFMKEPPSLKGLGLPGFKKSAAFNETIAAYKEIIKQEIALRAASIKGATIWETRWESGVTTVIKGMKDWQDVFTTVNASIISTWSDTISSFLNDTAVMARTFENFMESMFNSVLNSFNRFVADVVANDLWWSIFGQGLKRPFGTASLLPSSVSGAADISNPFYSSLLRRKDFMGRSSGGDAGTGLGMFAGKLAPNMTVNVINETGVEARGSASKPAFNGKDWVVNVLLEAMDTNPNVRDRVRG